MRHRTIYSEFERVVYIDNSGGKLSGGACKGLLLVALPTNRRLLQRFGEVFDLSL